MDLNAIGDFIARVGFPIAVAVWLLYITERMHNRNVQSIAKLTNQIVILTMLLSIATKIKVPELPNGDSEEK